MLSLPVRGSNQWWEFSPQVCVSTRCWKSFHCQPKTIGENDVFITCFLRAKGKTGGENRLQNSSENDCVIMLVEPCWSNRPEHNPYPVITDVQLLHNPSAMLSNLKLLLHLSWRIRGPAVWTPTTYWRPCLEVPLCELQPLICVLSISKRLENNYQTKYMHWYVVASATNLA